MAKARIEKSKKGYPVFWEVGFTNTGEATIVTNKNGKPKEVIHARSENGKHTLVILEVGDYIIEVNDHREEIEIYKVLDFKDKEKVTYAVMDQVHYYSRGEWDVEIPAYLEDVVEEAVGMVCYHYR